MRQSLSCIAPDAEPFGPTFSCFFLQLSVLTGPATRHLKIQNLKRLNTDNPFSLSPFSLSPFHSPLTVIYPL
jgi:hypothetical protein